MGDCHLHFRVDSSLCCSKVENQNDTPDQDAIPSDRIGRGRPAIALKTLLFTKVFSADTTIREVMDQTTFRDIKELDPVWYSPDVSMRSLMRGEQRARLWDCTLHPPRDVSDWPLHTYPAIKGSKSKTLYEAGWYPSGRLVLLPPNETPKLSSLEDDVQFNHRRPKPLLEKPPKVAEPQNTAQKLQPQPPPQKPSELILAAKSRFQSGDSNDHDSTESAKVDAQKYLRHQQLEQKRQRDVNRKRRLELCLRKLDDRIAADSSSNGRKAAVSAQVRRMLVKSRATGRTNLALQDRVYLHCIFLDEDKQEEEEEGQQRGGDTNNNNNNHQISMDQIRDDYCYFSRQDTIGRVLEYFQPPANRQIEFIVQIKRANALDPCYGKLPVLMRMYEAIERDYLSEADNQVILRIFDPTKHGTTPLVERLHDTADSCAKVGDPLKSNDLDPSNVCSQSNESTMGNPVDPPGETSSDLTRDPPGEASSDIVAVQSTSQLARSAPDDEAKSLQTAPSLETAKAETIPTMSSDPVVLKSEQASRGLAVINPTLTQAIQHADEGQGSSLFKRRSISSKATAAVTKVRQMQIKSKAIGDEKRVRPPDRFHVEVVVVTTESSLFSVQSFRYHFLSNMDKLSRLVRDYYAPYVKKSAREGTSNTVNQWDYLIWPAATSSSMEANSISLRRILDPNQSLQELKDGGLLQPFDIVILLEVA